MLFIALLLTSAAAVTMKNVVRMKAHVMVMYSGSGSFWGISDTYTVAKKWQSLLQEKVRTDPTWPFDASLEFYDVKSDMMLTTNILTWRFGNASAGLMPPVTAIFGPETNGIHFVPFFLLSFSHTRIHESMTPHSHR